MYRKLTKAVAAYGAIRLLASTESGKNLFGIWFPLFFLYLCATPCVQKRSRYSFCGYVQRDAAASDLS